MILMRSILGKQDAEHPKKQDAERTGASPWVVKSNGPETNPLR